MNKLPRNLINNSIVIDKSATYQCRHRLRFAKISGATTFLIPEELIAVSTDDVIPAAIHQLTSCYIDRLVTVNSSLVEYASKINLKHINCDNPRVNTFQILDTSNEFSLLGKMYNDLTPYILINDSTTIDYSSFENEEKLIHKLIQGTGVSPSKYIDDLRSYERSNKNRIQELVRNLISDKRFSNYKILIRPHPGADISKFEESYSELISFSSRILISRQGSALEAMIKASLIFHYNCTTGIEAFQLGLSNVFNIADEPRAGASTIALEATPPLGLEVSLKRALQATANVELNNKHPTSAYKSLASFIGSLYTPIQQKDDLKKVLFVKFEDFAVKSPSTKDRWSAAINYINRLSSLKTSNVNITRLGKVGIILGI